MIALLLTLFACETETACTELAAASLTLTLTGAGGAALVDPVVTYTVDGVDRGECTSFQEGSYTCGYEERGHFVVTASATGFETGTVEADVAADECHVIQEVVSLELEETACTAEVVASALVNLSGTGDEILEQSWVKFQPDGGEVADCSSADGYAWTCGEDVTGPMTITAGASGHQDGSTTVDVQLDEAGCHAVTETVDLALEWLPD
ncbi:hypothetical protein LBMAG42_00540 [Deltaproteobacteria bacterium]|nr:hypothetical protein LBMAG42_00540 [Deltaproteobacteria bacterium]